mmetsp:Transcript_16516/g.49965  ORF Transcript_16516/g.49965 Transcript_16516/m.49965 type:complete len:515 (+) Transcript_16516:357-1901(+)
MARPRGGATAAVVVRRRPSTVEGVVVEDVEDGVVLLDFGVGGGDELGFDLLVVEQGGDRRDDVELAPRGVRDERPHPLRPQQKALVAEVVPHLHLPGFFVDFALALARIFAVVRPWVGRGAAGAAGDEMQCSVDDGAARHEDFVRRRDVGAHGEDAVGDEGVGFVAEEREVVDAGLGHVQRQAAEERRVEVLEQAPDLGLGVLGGADVGEAELESEMLDDRLLEVGRDAVSVQVFEQHLLAPVSTQPVVRTTRLRHQVAAPRGARGNEVRRRSGRPARAVDDASVGTAPGVDVGRGRQHGAAHGRDEQGVEGDADDHDEAGEESFGRGVGGDVAVADRRDGRDGPVEAGDVQVVVAVLVLEAAQLHPGAVAESRGGIVGVAVLVSLGFADVAEAEPRAGEDVVQHEGHGQEPRELRHHGRERAREELEPVGHSRQDVDGLEDLGKAEGAEEARKLRRFEERPQADALVVVDRHQRPRHCGDEVQHEVALQVPHRDLRHPRLLAVQKGERRRWCC